MEGGRCQHFCLPQRAIKSRADTACGARACSTSGCTRAIFMLESSGTRKCKVPSGKSAQACWGNPCPVCTFFASWLFRGCAEGAHGHFRAVWFASKSLPTQFMLLL